MVVAVVVYRGIKQMNWIKLHERFSGKEMYINFDQIVEMVRMENMTYLYSAGMALGIEVKETPEEILSML